MNKWLFEKRNTEIWNTSDEYDTREEAIVAGREYFNDELEDDEKKVFSFCVGQQEPPSFGVNVDSVIENITEHVYSEIGEVSEDWLVKVPKDARERLEDKMNAVFNEWLTEESLQPRFFKIVNLEEIFLSESC